MIIGLIIAVAFVATGIALGGLTGVAEYCSGTVYDTQLCENAKLRESIFGAVLAGAGVIACAIVAGGALVASRSARAASASIDSEEMLAV
ncbi:MAG: CDP-diglyceride synthetase [Microbacterium sp.]